MDLFGVAPVDQRREPRVAARHVAPSTVLAPLEAEEGQVWFENKASNASTKKSKVTGSVIRCNALTGSVTVYFY